MASFGDNMATIYGDMYGANIRKAIYECLGYLHSNTGESVEMTKEEYDQLPEEIKNNGMTYYISDTGEIFKNSTKFGGGSANAGEISFYVLESAPAIGIAGVPVVPEEIEEEVNA